MLGRALLLGLLVVAANALGSPALSQTTKENTSHALEKMRGSWGGEMGNIDVGDGVLLNDMQIEVQRGSLRAIVTMNLTASKLKNIRIVINADYLNGRIDRESARFDKVPWRRTVPSTGQRDNIEGNPLVLRIVDGKLNGVFEGDDGMKFTLAKLTRRK